MQLKYNITFIIVSGVISLLGCGRAVSGTDFVVSESTVNTSVGISLIEDFRIRLRAKFCYEKDFGITVLDDGITAAPRRSINKKALSNDIVIKWLFESNQKLENDGRLDDNELMLHFLRPDSDNHVLAHELGHQWHLDNENWPSKIENEYASSGPDWIDEVIAIVFENPERLAKRRGRFRDKLANSEVFELDGFLSAQHPDFLGGGIYKFINMSTGKETIRSAETVDKDTYYAQALMFSEFLSSHTDDMCFYRRLMNLRSQHEMYGLIDGLVGLPSIDDVQTEFFHWSLKSR